MAIRKSRFTGLTIALAHCLLLVACGDDSGDSSASAQPPPSNPPPSAALTIAGEPQTLVEEGLWYSFMPEVGGVNGDVLSFSIQNRPTWATFDVSSGELQGTPGVGDIGTYSGIVIAAHNGSRNASLAPFGIEVLAAAGNGGPGIPGGGDGGGDGGDGGKSPGDGGDGGGSGSGGDGSGGSGGGSGSGGDGSGGGSGSDPADPVDPTDPGTPDFPPPTISGTPSGEVMQGQQFSFTPSGSSGSGQTLVYSVSNRPSWATFNTQTGRLRGTPGVADLGVYNNIVISVSDGHGSASLPAFSIAVVATANGHATLTWQPPSEREDGTPLWGALAGYRIYWGTTPGSYPNSVTINNPGVTTYMVEGLTPNTYYFVATAFDTNNLESGYSNIGTKTVQ